MLEAAALTGMDLRLVAPKACWPEAKLIAQCQDIAKKNAPEYCASASTVFCP